jgi:alcohol dehydrogenase, propanol-preferring
MMYAATLTGPRGPIAIVEHALADPSTGEALVRMEACGICHSDVMIAGLEKLPLSPVVLGHEGIGIVEAIGQGVTNVAPGERVGVTYFASSCGRCESCQNGRERFCLKQFNHGYSRHGALATHCVAAAQNLVKVPSTLSAAEAAPLCCAGWTAYGALREAAVKPGQLVAIFGLGGLGHLALQYARHAGARVAAVDVGEEKLALARGLGAEAALPAAEARRTLLKEFGGADAAIVFTAAAAAVPEAFGCLKRGGSLILVGLTGERFGLPVSEAVIKGIRIQGSFLGTRQDLEDVFRLATEGVAHPHVATHPLEETPQLIDHLRNGELVGRAVITF